LYNIYVVKFHNMLVDLLIKWECTIFFNYHNSCSKIW